MASINKDSKIEWRPDILPLTTKKALEFLSAQNWLARSQWYLAGGTALALYTGHRTSLDLDFFTPQKKFNLKNLLAHFSEDKGVWMADVAEEGTVFATLLGAKISFIAYPFFIAKERPHRYGFVRIVHPRDIAVMKAIAISQRGRKRDFVDMYWYVKNREPLSDILRRLPEQYPTVAHNYHHILKSFMYFDDADQDPMPRIFFDATWAEIKKYFQKEIPKITKEFLGLR